MTCFEFSDDLRQRQTFDFEQQQHVVEEIRGFADDFRVGLCDGGQRQLQAFLADFLRDPPGAFRDEFGGVAARRTRGDSLGDDLFEPAQERDALRARLGRTLAPTGGRASMAGGTGGRSAARISGAGRSTTRRDRRPTRTGCTHRSPAAGPGR